MRGDAGIAGAITSMCGAYPANASLPFAKATSVKNCAIPVETGCEDVAPPSELRAI